MPYHLFTYDRMRADFRVIRLFNLPGNRGDVCRNAADNLSLKIFDDLGPSLFPPFLCGSYLFPVLQRQDFGKDWKRVGETLVVIRVIGRLFISARTRPQLLDSKLVHHMLMIIIGIPLAGIHGLSGKHSYSQEYSKYSHCRSHHFVPLIADDYTTTDRRVVNSTLCSSLSANLLFANSSETTEA